MGGLCCGVSCKTNVVNLTPWYSSLHTHTHRASSVVYQWSSSVHCKARSGFAAFFSLPPPPFSRPPTSSQTLSLEITLSDWIKNGEASLLREDLKYCPVIGQYRRDPKCWPLIGSTKRDQ